MTRLVQFCVLLLYLGLPSSVVTGTQWRHSSRQLRFMQPHPNLPGFLSARAIPTAKNTSPNTGFANGKPMVNGMRISTLQGGSTKGMFFLMKKKPTLASRGVFSRNGINNYGGTNKRRSIFSRASKMRSNKMRSNVLTLLGKGISKGIGKGIKFLMKKQKNK